jgi:hypothetical protein
MIGRDYIMTQIEVLTTVIAKVLFKKDINQKEEIRFEIAKACKTLIGLDYNFINKLPMEQVVSFFSITGKLDVIKTFVAAKLFQLAADGEEEAEKTVLKNKSRYLYSVLLSNTNDNEHNDLRKEVSDEINKIDTELNPETQN